MRGDNIIINKNAKVYLSGPIEGADDDGVKWRQHLTPKLQELSFTILDPLEKESQHIVDNKTPKEACYSFKRSGHWDQFMRVMSPIIQEDMDLVKQADFVIVYWNTQIHSYGTMCEIWEAYTSHKPVLMVLHGNKSDVSSWLLCTVLTYGIIFNSFNQLINFIKEKVK